MAEFNPKYMVCENEMLKDLNNAQWISEFTWEYSLAITEIQVMGRRIILTITNKYSDGKYNISAVQCIHRASYAPSELTWEDLLFESCGFDTPALAIQDASYRLSDLLMKGRFTTDYDAVREEILNCRCAE